MKSCDGAMALIATTVLVKNERQQQVHIKAQTKQGLHQAEPRTVGNAIGLLRNITPAASSTAPTFSTPCGTEVKEEPMALTTASSRQVIVGKRMPPNAPTTAHIRGGRKAAALRRSLTINGTPMKEQRHRPPKAQPQLPALNCFINSGANQSNGRGTPWTIGAKRYRVLKTVLRGQATIRL